MLGGRADTAASPLRAAAHGPLRRCGRDLPFNGGNSALAPLTPRRLPLLTAAPAALAAAGLGQLHPRPGWVPAPPRHGVLDHLSPGGVSAEAGPGLARAGGRRGRGRTSDGEGPGSTPGMGQPRLPPCVVSPRGRDRRLEGDQDGSPAGLASRGPHPLLSLKTPFILSRPAPAPSPMLAAGQLLVCKGRRARPLPHRAGPGWRSPADKSFISPLGRRGGASVGGA